MAPHRAGRLLPEYLVEGQQLQGGVLTLGLLRPFTGFGSLNKLRGNLA